ncbi:MAG: type II toxin-antitoxin system RelE family toxin [Chitinophagaceae bacterium]
MYQLVIEKYAQKQLQRIAPSQIPSIKKTIGALANNPRPAGFKKLKGVDAYRVRSGDYRIIYEIHDKIVTVVVVDIGHRRDIYKGL